MYKRCSTQKAIQTTTSDTATPASQSELIETLGATLDYEGISGKLADENIRLRKAAESLWDGVTDVLSQTEIDRVERMYKAELTLLLGSP